jgi:beta-glucosidase
MEPYRDPSRTADERAADLLSRMSLTEKVGQLNQRLLGWHAWRRDGDRVEITRELEDEAARWGGIGAVYGPLRADAWSGRDWATGADPALSPEVTARLQERVTAASRFGIPALLVEEAPHGHQALGGSLFPVPLALGSSWRPELAEEAAAHTAAELRARGAHLALVSGLDILRDPRWGRSEECFGEDPLLAGEFVRAVVTGYRSVPGIGAVLKHFAGQGAGIGGRNSSGAPIGPRELAEIHLPAARAGIEAGAAGVMAAYNDVDGVPCCANESLLTGLLRDEWGFAGVVMADMFAVDRLQRSTASPAHAGALAVRAGVDLSMCDESFAALDEAVAAGLLDEAAIDRACGRVLRLKIELGLLDPPAALPAFPPPPRTDVTAGMVLLADPAGTLPLPAAARVALLGPLADDLPALLGDYVPPLAGGPIPTVLDALTTTVEVVAHEPGSGLTEATTGGLERAVAAARAADVAILVLGTTAERGYDDDFDTNGAARLDGARPRATTGEGFDSAEVRLPEAQLELARAVAESGTRLVAVVIAGRPLGLAELAATGAAVLFVPYPGPAGAGGIADVLTGVREPGGRLSVSLPTASGMLPAAYDERLETTTRYIDGEAAAAFPFGTGLGYSSWELGPLRGLPDAVAGTPAGLALSVELRNTGARHAGQVVQLYARARIAGLVPRRAVLVGFARADAEPGARVEVPLRIGAVATDVLGLRAGATGTLEVWASLDGPGAPANPAAVELTAS